MRHTARLLLALTFAAVALTNSAQAGFRDAPPALPGWTHSPAYSDDSPDRHGLVLSGGPISRGSPVIAEIDGNPANNNEVAVGGDDGKLYVYGQGGNLVWETQVIPSNCADASQSKINGAPAVGPLFGDGVPYVVIGYGTSAPSNCDGGIAVYDGRNGAERYRFSLRAWQQSQGYPAENFYVVFSAPALADVDNNGTLEIAFGGFDRNVYLLNANGSVRWYYHAADTVWASPAFLNTDSDANLELIVATDISANPNLNPPTSNGGLVYAFDTEERSTKRIEFQQGFIWRTAFDQVIYSSPVIADLLPSNPGLEVAFGSGCFFPSGDPNKRGRWIKIINPSNGALLQTLNAPACVQSTPAVGDIDDDGALELVATVSGDSSIGGDGKSYMVAWDPTEVNPKWQRALGDANSGMNDPFGGDIQSALIADLDGNGSLEVIASNFWSVHVLNGKTGEPLTCQKSPDCGNQASMYAWYTLKSTPAIGDIDNDGKLDLVIGGSNIFNTSRGHLYAWTGFAGTLSSPAGSQPAYSAPWPQFRRDATHSGKFISRAFSLASSALNFTVTAAGSATQSFRISSTDGSALAWTLSELSDPDDLISISVGNGSTANNSQPSFAINATNKPSGNYTASFQLSAAGVPSVTVAVNVRVVDTLYTVAIPMVQR